MPDSSAAADAPGLQDPFARALLVPANTAAGTDSGLTAAILTILQGADHARLAVGYLFVQGLIPLAGALADVPRIDLLIGNVVNRLTDEQIRETGTETAVQPAARSKSEEEFAASYRDARNDAAAQTALAIRRTIDALTRTADNRNVVLDLARWIAEGRLHVNLSTRHRLHAKVTLAGYSPGHPNAPGRAIVGTSNITMPLALEPDPSNLDVLLEGEENYRQLTRWFDRHWAEAQDFHRELFQELGRAWPLAEP